MRVLLTEGNGLTSRQVATHLDRLGHHVEVLTPDPLCLARFTKHVRRLHRSPRLVHLEGTVQPRERIVAESRRTVQPAHVLGEPGQA